MQKRRKEKTSEVNERKTASKTRKEKKRKVKFFFLATHTNRNK
jgi:hypothetical protein